MGVGVAALVMALWATSLVLSLEKGSTSMSVLAIAVTVAVCTYLTTGLFITAHDAMHGTVSNTKRINDFIGVLVPWWRLFETKRPFSP